VWVIDLLAPAVHRLSAQHQSDNQQSALADCLADVDAVISTFPIRREMCNPAGVGFHRIVEIRPDLDSRIGYLSIPNCYTFQSSVLIVTLLHTVCVCVCAADVRNIVCKPDDDDDNDDDDDVGDDDDETLSLLPDDVIVVDSQPLTLAVPSRRVFDRTRLGISLSLLLCVCLHKCLCVCLSDSVDMIQTGVSCGI